MSELTKLRPDRDLQCYFLQPSAVAALSGSSSSGFAVSGTWRQQFDWAVVEWNRDNVFEHPALRNLPDGDLRSLTLSYQETRTNCIPLDSDLFHTVSWPFLRVWAPDDSGAEQVYQVPLTSYATPVAGSYASAYADFTLSGTITPGDFVGIAYLTEQFTYPVGGWEGTVENLLDQMILAITGTALIRAVRTGTTLRVYYTAGADIGSSTTGANGNRFSVYTYACSSTGGASTLSWDSVSQTFANGTSPTQWQVTIPFNSLQGYIDPNYVTLHPINHSDRIRKLRWTYSADLQAGVYSRSEFEVVVSSWSVTGTNLNYSVAGPGSRRFEDYSTQVTYSGSWTLTDGMSRGNYSGGTIHLTTTQGDSVSCTYSSPSTHTLYLGTRCTANGALVSITVDGVDVGSANLLIPGEDVLIRWPVGEYAAGNHTIVVTHGEAAPTEFWFDFIEAAVATTTLPTFPDEPRMTLATDWDTNHSLALAPERTAWLMDTLGFKARGNHYVGALWFYELVCSGQVYASGTVTFAGPADSDPGVTYSVTLTLGRTDQPGTTILTKLIHMGDTQETLARAFADELNRGYMSFRASVSGNVLTIYSRSMGLDGTFISVAATTTNPDYTLTITGTLTAGVYTLAGGMDGQWLTDLTASPRLNRAVRDWTSSFFAALHGYGIDTTGSLSMELQFGDTSVAAGIAQRGPTGVAVTLPTPSLQTNFSPTSLAFWQEVYAEIAGIQAGVGLQPFVQFGEVQWWYFPSNNLPVGEGLVDYFGMPFYDAWTQNEFLTEFGHAMATITTNTVDPAAYPDEVSFLPVLVGNFTSAIMSYVLATQATSRFEVLYPGDVNQTAFNQAINFAAAAWTASTLTVLKTECFGFTLGRDLDSSETVIDSAHGFPAAQRSHLVGIGDATTAWLKEASSAAGKGFESVVLFALDQFCLIGYPVPLPASLRRSLRMGP